MTLFATGVSAGLVAGGASCAAVQGGLLAAAVGRRRPAEIEVREPVAVGAAATGGEEGFTAGADEHPEVDEPSDIGEPSRTAAWWTRTRADARPVGIFLGAKLTSHTLLGALLGTVGSAAQPSPRTRAMLLLAAAVLMVGFGLNLLGVRGFRRLVPTAPEAWTRWVRRSARSESQLAPAVLGFLTFLLPCGVTLSMALLAITSTSALAGAAVMAGFVLGTAPLFASLGFLLRTSTRVLQGRLSMLTGLAVLVIAVITSTSALRLGGWAFQGGGGPVPAASVSALSTAPDGAQVVTVAVGEKGYTPSAVLVRPGVPTRLVLTTAGIRGCTSTIVFPSRNLQRSLPPTGRTVIDLGRLKAGTLRWTCGIGMYSGHLAVSSVSTPTTVRKDPA